MPPLRPVPPPHSTLVRILEAAEEYPSNLALKTRDASLTYAELVQRAGGLARVISRRCDPGDRVGVLAGDDATTYVSLLATWMAGCAYVPFHRGNPTARVEEIARKAGTRLILGGSPDPSTAAAAHRIGAELLVPAADASLDGPVDPVPVPADTLAYILFTSGSTGHPKGVPITHENLSAFVDAWVSDPSFSLGPEDRVLQMFDLTFDLSVLSFFIPLTRGASCHIVPAAGIPFLNVARILKEERITFAMLVPSLLGYLHRYFDEIRLPDLRHCMFAGEALLHDLVVEWSRCAPKACIQNSYGPTEATILCTIYDWEVDRATLEAEGGVVPIGKPMAGIEAVVLDDQDRVVGPGIEGELCLRGAQVMGGYWDDPERTLAPFVQLRGTEPTVTPPMYRTGDLVRQNTEGLLSWLMRKDFQVKIDGHRIELGEIEAHARRLADTPNVIAVVRRSPEGFANLVLFFAGGECLENELADGLAKLLPPYMRPRWVRRIPELPLAASGKIDRMALARREL